jgi:integrase
MDSFKLSNGLEFQDSLIATVRQDTLYTGNLKHFKDLGVVSGENPAARVRKPKRDNQRDRFLSQAEATALLNILANSSQVTHDLAVLSLFSGLRAGECRALT